MSHLEAFVLGLVQGLTEFLPISSSGHLILVPWLFNWEQPGLNFDAALHLGTLLAVLVYFWRDLVGILKSIPYALSNLRGVVTGQQSEANDEFRSARLGFLLVIGCIPAGLVGLIGENKIDDWFHSQAHEERSVAIVATMLIVFGLLLYVADRRAKLFRRIRDMQLIDAAIIGCAQALALIPGVSRSGITLTAGLFRGLKREDAARFSFLVGVPLILVAGLTGVVDLLGSNPSRTETINLMIGMVTAAITGFITIWALLRYLQTSNTTVFVIYRVVVGTLVLASLLLG